MLGVCEGLWSGGFKGLKVDATDASSEVGSHSLNDYLNMTKTRLRSKFPKGERICRVTLARWQEIHERVQVVI